MNDYNNVDHHGKHNFLNDLLVKGVSLSALREEAGKLDGAIAGTVAANKVVIAGATKNIDVLAIADLKLGAGAGTSVTATATELNLLDGAVDGVGAVAGTGNAVTESLGMVQKTRIALTNHAIALTDEAGTIAFGGSKIYDFPAGVIVILGAVMDLDLTKSSAGVNDNWDGDVSLGSVTAANDADLTGTEADIIAKTATPQAAAGATTADGQSAAAAYIDGSATAVDVFLNFLVDDADHDVTSTPCNLIANGVITLTWVNLGDN